MNLLYVSEHTTCPNYQKADHALIRFMELPKATPLKFVTEQDSLIFLIEGSLEFSFAGYRNKTLTKGQVLMLPGGYSASASPLEDCQLISVRMLQPFQLCDSFALEKLLKGYAHHKEHAMSVLPVNEMLDKYLKDILFYLNQGVLCTFFQQMKIKELFFIMRYFYTKEDLLDFFYLQLTSDVTFSKKVYANYLSAKNAQELAKMLNYSYSGFIKRFNKVFNAPPYRWIMEKKAEQVLHEINASNKSLGEISQEYGFSSQGQLSEFCKAQFELLPNEIRKNRKNPLI